MYFIKPQKTQHKSTIGTIPPLKAIQIRQFVDFNPPNTLDFFLKKSGNCNASTQKTRSVLITPPGFVQNFAFLGQFLRCFFFQKKQRTFEAYFLIQTRLTRRIKRTSLTTCFSTSNVR